MKPAATASLLILLTCNLPASATVTDAEFSQLRADLLGLLERVETLEAENRELKASSEKVMRQTAEKSSWSDSITLKGDLRYRYENIDAERSDTRERNRIRARAVLIANPADDWEVGIGIASGDDDPVSTNQTLGGSASTKDVRLDLAYFKWHAKPGLNVIGGKMKNVYHRAGDHSLLWDGDLNPEGLAITFERDKLFFNTGFNFMESDTKSNSSDIVYGAQGGFHGTTGFGHLVAGISYFDLGIKGRESFFGDADDFFGNTFRCTDPTALTGCEYLNDFEEVEIFAQLATSVGDMPLSIFADYVKNNAADDLDTGWAAGFTLGSANTHNAWELGYVYQDLEADAVFGLTTDSDFGGGGTDASGHIFKGSWAFSSKWKVAFTYFLNERNMDVGVEEDYDRIQIDTAFKF